MMKIFGNLLKARVKIDFKALIIRARMKLSGERGARPTKGVLVRGFAAFGSGTPEKF